MNKKLISVILAVVVFSSLASMINAKPAYALPLSAKTYTVTASSVSFISGVPNSDKNWVQAKVTCNGSYNFKLSTSLPTWPFNPANWSAQWCKNNTVQIGIPNSFYLWVFTQPGGPYLIFLYRNPANWKVSYT
jgi:hypothetical protein